MENGILLGIEIEMAYNEDNLGYIERDCYHGDGDELFGDYFIAEEDGSLNGSDYCGETVELISNPVKYKDFELVINDFIYEVKRRYKLHTGKKLGLKGSLSGIIDFNESCGCHINFSVYQDSAKENNMRLRGGNFTLPKTCKFFGAIDDKTLVNIRKKIKNKMELLNGSSYFNNIYDRRYSRVDDKNPTNNIDNKYSEFHLKNNSLMEYRSFNLHGCKTLYDVKKRLMLGASIINNVIVKELNKSKPLYYKGEIKVNI